MSPRKPLACIDFRTLKLVEPIASPVLAGRVACRDTEGVVHTLKVLPDADGCTVSAPRGMRFVPDNCHKLVCDDLDDARTRCAHSVLERCEPGCECHDDD